MSTAIEIRNCEITRLGELAIPYECVHVTEDRAVVRVDGDTMRRIINDRDRGMDIGGLFVSVDDRKLWTASWIDASGEPQHRDGLTINMAYKAVLGYYCGRHPRDGRWRGYCPAHPYKSSEDEF